MRPMGSPLNCSRSWHGAVTISAWELVRCGVSRALIAERLARRNARSVSTLAELGRRLDRDELARQGLDSMTQHLLHDGRPTYQADTAPSRVHRTRQACPITTSTSTYRHRPETPARCGYGSNSPPMASATLEWLQRCRMS